MRRPLRDGMGLVLLGAAVGALALGALLSRATTEVKNWFVMTDELFYERLAISIARSGSLVSELQVNQLYPAILSLLFGNGDVPASLAAAHRLNAFLFASAAVPVALLARRVGARPLLAVATGLVAVAVPWAVLASFLLSEVVAYPAFCWALLALTFAVERRTAAADALALAAIAVAVLARVQFLLLLAVLVLAVVADALLQARADGRSLRRTAVRLPRARPVLAALVAAGLAVVLAAAVGGAVSRLLGRYAVTAEDVRLDAAFAELVLGHLAAIALGLAILPFLLAAAWLLDRLRPSAPPRERAFALVASLSLALLTAQVASFDQRFGGGLVKDRYLFYVVPGLLVALAACVASRRQPPWWAVLAAAVPTAAGFALLDLPTYEKLNADSVLAMLNDELVRLSTSGGLARLSLVMATVVAAQLLVLGRLLVPARALAAAAAVLVAVALPAQAAYAFERLFRVDGTNGLPVTLDQGVVFNWIDRALAGDDPTTLFTYPLIPGDYWAGVGYWWETQFWNESVTHVPVPGGTSARPDRWVLEFDEETGLVRGFEQTSYAAFHSTDVRFRLAGKDIVAERDAFLIEPDRPWRAGFLTFGVYGDGWTQADEPARIRVYAEPGQATPLRRFLTIAAAAPEGPERPVTIESNVGRAEHVLASGGAAEWGASACVPPGGWSEVVLTAPVVSPAGPDLSRGPGGAPGRLVGVELRRVSMAGEREPMEACP